MEFREGCEGRIYMTNLWITPPSRHLRVFSYEFLRLGTVNRYKLL